MSSEEQAGLVEELIQILEEKQRGIHASELSEGLLLKDCPPDAFLSLAAQDGRLKIAQGRYVYLAKWGSPRRETLGQAITAVLEKARKPLTFDAVVSLVERRVGRKYDRPDISGALQTLEAEFDAMTKVWSVRTPPTGDGDDDADVADGDSFHLRQVTLQRGQTAERIALGPLQDAVEGEHAFTPTICGSLGSLSPNDSGRTYRLRHLAPPGTS